MSDESPVEKPEPEAVPYPRQLEILTMPKSVQVPGEDGKYPKRKE